jgi:hypothetical protein
MTDRRPAASPARRSRASIPLSCAGIAAAAMALGGGCNYSFRNPAEKLAAGEVSGRAVAPGSGPISGASVSLRGSAFDQSTRPTGRFSLLPLPAGRHTILVRQGLDRAEIREVEVGYGSGGQTEGVNLGDLELPRAASVSGTLIAVGSSSGEGVIVDETTGMSAAVLDFQFRMGGLPVGSHRLSVATHSLTGNWAGGPVAITITDAEAGSDKVLAPISLEAAVGTGHLRLRTVSLVEGMDAQDVPVSVTNVDGVDQGDGAPDSNGDRDWEIAAGAYHVQVGTPGSSTEAAPPARAAVVLQGNVADLGSFYVIPVDTIAAAQLWCHQDADCASGPCSGGYCAAAPDPVPPATAPVCSDAAPWTCVTLDADCDVPGDVTPGWCVENPVAGPTHPSCLPCNTLCTPDGVKTISAECL